MALLTRVQFKALWIKGYKPTESDYDDLWDSFFNVSDDLFVMEIALAQKDTDIQAVAAVADPPIPEDLTFVRAFINVTVAPVGSDAVWDVNVNGATALSTKITIEAGETSSLTAASQPVFSSSDFDEGDPMSIDCDQAGASTAGQNPVLVLLYKKRY